SVSRPLRHHLLKCTLDLMIHQAQYNSTIHSYVLSSKHIFKQTNALFKKVRDIQHEGGAVPSPFECWLALRGLQTFPYRVRAQSETALRIAEFFSRQPAIEAVHYPGLPGHPGHKVAAGLMSSFGGMLSIQDKGDKPEAMKMAG